MTTLRRPSPYGNAWQTMFAASVVPDVKTTSLAPSARMKSTTAWREAWSQASTCWLSRWVERLPPQPPQFA